MNNCYRERFCTLLVSGKFVHDQASSHKLTEEEKINTRYWVGSGPKPNNTCQDHWLGPDTLLSAI